MKPSRTARTARFHYAGELQSPSELTLSKSASHHLVTVLRTRQGDVIELFNGNGFNFRATVIDTGQRSPGKCALLQVHDVSPSHTRSPVDVTLIQAISRGDRMDTCLRQSIELGANTIQPIYSRHSVKALDDKRTLKKLEHWQSILVSASEQSGRADLPTLSTPLTLTNCLENLTAELHRFAAIYVLDPSAHRSLVTHLRTFQATGHNSMDTDSSTRTASTMNIGLIIGPESGLDSDEIEQACQAGAQAVTIGPRILRTETAGPACIALIQATLGDLG